MSKLKIFLISLLILFASALAFFVFYLKNNEDVVAKLTFTNGKAHYNSQEVAFDFSNSDILNTSDIEVIKAHNQPFDDENLYYRSYNTFLLKGKLSAFTGKLKISFKLGERMLKKYGKKLNSNLFILGFEESFRYPEKDTVLAANFMRIKIDFDKKEAYTYYDFSKLNYTDSTKNYKIGFELVCYEENLKTYLSSDYTYQNEGNFVALYNEKPNKKALDFVLNEMEKQYSKIRNLNFTVQNNSKPIQLRITGIDNPQELSYIQNIYFPEKKWFEIKEAPYFNRNPESLSEKEIKSLRLQSGRNIMAFALNNSAFDLAFNEAVSTWYEPIALSDSSYFKNIELEDFQTLNQTILSDDSKMEKLHSLFFSILMRKGGFYFGSKLYQNLNQNSRSLTYNIQKTLVNKKLSNIYIEFLDLLLRKPEKLFPGLSSNDILDELSYDNLKMKVKINGQNVDISHTEELNLGSLSDAHSEKAITINYQLKNLSTAFLKFNLKSQNSKTKEKFLKGEYKLKISLSGNEKIGTFVYKRIGNKLVSSAENLIFHTNTSNSELILNESGEFVICIINFDDSEEILKNRNLSMKFEILK